MKTISALIVLTVILGGSVQAAERDDLDSCAMWNTMERVAKSAFVFGFAVGARAAGVVANQYVRQSTVPKVTFGVESIIESVVWPKGHRFGSVVIEINVECQKPGNEKQSIMVSILNIAERLNNQK